VYDDGAILIDSGGITGRDGKLCHCLRTEIGCIESQQRQEQRA
jgi:hypothetical protein